MPVFLKSMVMFAFLCHKYVYIYTHTHTRLYAVMIALHQTLNGCICTDLNVCDVCAQTCMYVHRPACMCTDLHVCA